MITTGTLLERVTVERAESIGDIPAHEWDEALTDEDLYSSHAWLRSLDDAQGPADVLVARREGRCYGGLPVWTPAPAATGLFGLPSYFPEVAGPWREPFLWAGGRRSVRNTIPVAPFADWSSVVDQLLQTGLGDATACGMAGIIVPFLPADLAVRVGQAVPQALVMAHDAEAIIDVPGGGLAEMPLCDNRDRSKRRAELSAFARSGGTIETVPVTTEILERAAPLIAETRAKYGNRQGTSWVRDQLVAQYKCGLFDDAAAFLCRVDHVIVSLNISFIRGQVMYARYFGADYTRQRPSFDYFVCNYYAPVDYAALHGVRRYVLSTSALDAKVRRGARLAPLVAVVIPVNGHRPSVDAVRGHNSSFVRQFQERYRTRPAALGGEWRLLA